MLAQLKNTIFKFKTTFINKKKAKISNHLLLNIEK